MASDLRVAASALPSALDSIAVRAGGVVWRGPAADRFLSELQDQRRRLRALADELGMAARGWAADADALDVISRVPLGPPVAPAVNPIPPRFS
jgi:hypothetical protein